MLLGKIKKAMHSIKAAVIIFLLAVDALVTDTYFQIAIAAISYTLIFGTYLFQLLALCNLIIIILTIRIMVSQDPNSKMRYSVTVFWGIRSLLESRELRKNKRKDPTQECVHILKEIGASPKIIQEFKAGNVLCTKEATEEIVAASDEQKATIKRMTEKDFIVYHIISSSYPLSGGTVEIDTYLCLAAGKVVLHKQKDSYLTFAYVENLSKSRSSECGVVAVKASGNIIKRIF